MLNSWSTTRGIDSSAQNLVEEAGQGDEQGARYFNKILADGASNIKRGDRDAGDPLYIAPSYKNGADHPRWINRNWPEIESQLSKVIATVLPLRCYRCDATAVMLTL